MPHSRERTLTSSCATVDDPRIDRTKAHTLLASIRITILPPFAP